MKSIYEIIQRIKSARGNAKISVISAVGDDDTNNLKLVVGATLDNMLSYHVSKIDTFEPSIFDNGYETGRKIFDIIAQLNYMNGKGGANADDKLTLAKIRHALPTEEDQLIADMIVARKLDCGASLSTFRKVWGKDFMPDFPVALISSYNEKKILKNVNFKKGAYSQLKSDGARCECIVDSSRGRPPQFHSRNGKKFLGLDQLSDDVIGAMVDINWYDCAIALDGELVVVDECGNILPRQTGNGILNKSIMGTITKEEAERVRFVCWDLIEYEVMLGITKPTETYSDQFQALEYLASHSDKKRFYAIESKLVYSLGEAAAHYAEMVSRGEEGTILKDAGGLWAPTHVTWAFKFKEEHDAELEIIGWEYGQGIFEKCIGALIVQSACGMIQCRIGSGLTNTDRGMKKVIIVEADPLNEILEECEWVVDEDFDLDSVIGKIADCTYNARTVSEGRDDVESLFLGRLNEIRFDKDTAQTRGEIIAGEEAKRALMLLAK